MRPLEPVHESAVRAGESHTRRPATNHTSFADEVVVFARRPVPTASSLDFAMKLGLLGV